MNRQQIQNRIIAFRAELAVLASEFRSLRGHTTVDDVADIKRSATDLLNSIHGTKSKVGGGSTTAVASDTDDENLPYAKYLKERGIRALETTYGLIGHDFPRTAFVQMINNLDEEANAWITGEEPLCCVADDLTGESAFLVFAEYKLVAVHHYSLEHVMVRQTKEAV